MPLLSFSHRSPALLLLGLLLGGCFSSRPCPSDRELDTIAAGQLDYVFEDGVSISADLADPTIKMIVGVNSGELAMNWRPPVSPGGDEVSNFILSIDLPEADGSFDLSDITANVCACESGVIAPRGGEMQCVLLSDQKILGPAECRAPAGQLTIVHTVVGDCEATRGGCLRNNVIKVVMNDAATKGLLGSVTFVESSETRSGSCVSSPFGHGFH